MTTISNEVRIDGPIETVFDIVTTARYWPLWHPATAAVDGIISRPLTLGDQVRERAVIAGRSHEGVWTVSEHTRPERLVLQIDDARISIAYAFAQVEQHALLRRVLDYRPQDFAGGDADPAALETQMYEQSREALLRLKSVVELYVPLERNKLTARRTLERAFNERDFAALDDGFTPDALIHDPGVDFHGPAELRQGLERLLEAFSDFHFTVEDQLAEGDRVMIRYRGQGTHRGEFLGIPATGQRIDYTGMLLLRLEGGRIAALWANPDQLGLLQQLGATISSSHHNGL